MSVWKYTAVSALRWEMSTPISLVPSIDANATRFAPSSTTAMFIGWPTCCASSLQAARIASACSSVICRAIVPPVQGCEGVRVRRQKTRMAASAGACSRPSISSSSWTRVSDTPAMSSAVQYAFT